MKKIIGYTTGVFDMFHIGHLNILKHAKEKCDYLIVGVSSDEVVESYKNKTPIIPFEHRKKIVESIKCVDEVVVQSHRDKMKSFYEIGFDIMFVGSDWKNTVLFNALEKELKTSNVRIHYFEYTEGISSSRLKKILEADSKK